MQNNNLGRIHWASGDGANFLEFNNDVISVTPPLPDVHWQATLIIARAV
jgi:hypothetical protein